MRTFFIRTPFWILIGLLILCTGCESQRILNADFEGDPAGGMPDLNLPATQ